jgi:two-component system, OmpR family, sensor histidine kinase KdpD
MEARPPQCPSATLRARRATRIADARRPDWIDVHAGIIAAETVPVGSSSGLRCVLDDGTGQLDVLFLGRHKVPGLHVGAVCAVTGRVAMRKGRPVVWNPRYRLDGAAPEAGTAEPATTATSPNREVATRDEPVAQTGRFRVYLGMAAGVGKTYAMLDEAHRRAARGRDVVIGCVTTHGRAATDRLLAGLEVVPRKTVDYRGAVFEEMDVDAILARNPDVVLVDELAHSNVPGSGRNEKRWQDVLELLRANVNVITTVNVQHIASLADVVEQITGTPVRERVPDSVLRQADQIELIDSSPEQLRRRMLHGNIYPPGRVDQALKGFFETDNLTALRELTLRFLADETDGDLLEQLRRSRPDRAWQTAERVLVGVTTAAGTDVVLQRAARIAARLKAELHVAHISAIDSRRRADAATLAAVRELAEHLGARWIQTQADDPAPALMRIATERQVTQIVLGPSHRSRWREMFDGGSTVRRLTRLAGPAGIDVHIIVRPSAAPPSLDTDDAVIARPVGPE